ncbi:MAG: chemotaxis protein cheY [Micavibrio sp.]|nr:chemotaxis protein cheY [Micavibrio sp.]
MLVVKDSAEHHFLTQVDKFRSNPVGWVAIHAALGRRIDHEHLVDDPKTLAAKLAEIKKESDNVMGRLDADRGGFRQATLYQFADSDLMLLFRPHDKDSHDAFYDLFKTMSATMKSGLVDFIDFGRDILGAQKLADRKLLAQLRMRSYEALADEHCLASIPVRRARRDNAIVQIVEDDRFTATYTTGILNKDYDVLHSRTGENAILDYIENAPDIVFLDIHLPGLDGLETLLAIRRADPAAHVVMVSVDTVKENIVTATERGAASFLKKPFSKDRLVAIVEKSPYIKGSKSILGRP